jgi:hypothetical protein
MRAVHILTLALALSLLLAGLALASGDLERPREVLGGGASDSTVGGVSLRATLGQPVVGVISGKGVTLGQGFWHGGAEYRVYLPLVLRNS